MLQFKQKKRKIVCGYGVGGWVVGRAYGLGVRGVVVVVGVGRVVAAVVPAAACCWWVGCRGCGRVVVVAIFSSGTVVVSTKTEEGKGTV